MFIGSFIFSKVIVGELLEHRVAKRASFVGISPEEPVYFSLYSFTLVGLLTDCIFEAFSDIIYEDNPLESEINLRTRLYTQLLPKDVGMKRGFGYSQVRYDDSDSRKRDEW